MRACSDSSGTAFESCSRLQRVTVLVLAMLALLAIGHALKPAGKIVEAVARLGDGEYQVRLPDHFPSARICDQIAGQYQ